MSESNNEATTAVSVGEHLGRVKWFNSKLGYGFITTTVNNEELDIFVHQSNVRPNVSKYRTLREGEYVSLNISESGETRQAIDITGVNGGPLNCDLERNLRNTRRNFNEDGEESGNGNSGGLETDSDNFTEVPRRGRRPNRGAQREASASH